MRRALLLAALLVALVVALPAFAAGHVTVKCKGMGTSCHAKVGLKGGASDKTVTVKLPGSGWSKAPTVKVSNKTLKGAYSLAHGHFTSGGKTWVATLSAVQSIRSGYLLLTFKH